MAKPPGTAHDAAMNKINAALVVVILLGVRASFAQDAIPVMPVVPAGISPILTWMLSILTIVITVTLPIAVAFLKQRVDVANAADRNVMIGSAVKHGAMVTRNNQARGISPTQAVADGLAYVKNAVPDSIGKVSQATDTHLSNMIKAEVVGLDQATPPVTVDTTVVPSTPPPPKSISSLLKGS